MNIHFSDTALFEELKRNSIFSIEVGSGMYNLKTPNSDIDILHIYLDDSRGLYETNHQLQYNGDNTNHIFTSLEQFIRNILSGDSTINFEVIYSYKFKEAYSEFHELFSILSKYNIKTIRSYLGMAKRDLKNLRYKFSGKKLSHFIRGVSFADCILENKNIYDFIMENRDFLLKMKESTVLTCDISQEIIVYELSMNILRSKIENTQQKIDFRDALKINNIINYFYSEYSSIKNNKIQELICKAAYNNDFGYV